MWFHWFWNEHSPCLYKLASLRTKTSRRMGSHCMSNVAGVHVKRKKALQDVSSASIQHVSVSEGHAVLRAYALLNQARTLRRLFCVTNCHNHGCTASHPNLQTHKETWCPSNSRPHGPDGNLNTWANRMWKKPNKTGETSCIPAALHHDFLQSKMPKTSQLHQRA